MSYRACIMIGVVALLAGCVAGDGEEDPALDDDNGDVEASSDAISVAGRWKITADARAGGARARFAYDDAPLWGSTRCHGGLRAGAERLRAKLNAQFDPQISRIEGYACRRNTASSARMSVHGTGRAVDIFIPRASGGADNTKGDAVANFLVKNAQELGVQMVIWDRSRWMVGRGEAQYMGPHPHDDHVHAELTEEASR
jgi:hypothetical protein